MHFLSEVRFCPNYFSAQFSASIIVCVTMKSKEQAKVKLEAHVTAGQLTVNF